MRLRLFRAVSTGEAMRLIREELGPDALILNSRRTADGVEITAAVDDEPEPILPVPAAPMPAAPLGSRPPAAPPPPAAAPVSPTMAALTWHGVPRGLAERLCHGELAHALSRALGFAAPPLLEAAKPLLFVGPPGAGKTLSLVKIATKLVMQGIMPVVVTADMRRAGATEQLAAFTRLLGLDLIVAGTPATLARVLARREPGAPMLIDSPGGDAFDAAQMEELQALAAATEAAMLAVMPAGLDVGEAAETGAAYGEAGAAWLLATKLDLARRLGGIVAAAHEGRLALGLAGTGPGAADGLAALSADALANRLMQHGSRGRPARGKEAA